MDISTYTLEALKALAYDLLGQLEQDQANLRTVNAEIAKRSDKNKEEEKPKKDLNK